MRESGRTPARARARAAAAARAAVHAAPAAADRPRRPRLPLRQRSRRRARARGDRRRRAPGGHPGRGRGDGRASVKLTDYRDRFPILESTTYLINHSLGAMPAEAARRLARFADEWTTRGARAWGEGWWETP